ncbi:diguanylate cyclase [Paraglaciecola aquimarina]|uniref:Diguanylate cyclase n=1 Tax=Paraglaciecola algarum TaxID=3050085 RepID=A0ABS9D6I0_9ALTE|nr:sensor domain-containing diguanylate cyclase [Paraglaciecola sp. G1-23]MCF2948567.1 diguanylate cyclase [Paraglaciecola sp. G1-23]
MGNFEDLTLKNLLENANIGVVIHKWDTSVIYANPTALNLLRLTHEQIIGRDAFDPQWRFIDEAKRALASEQFPVFQVKRFKEPLQNVVIGVIDSKQTKPSWFLLNAYPEIAEDEKNSFIVVTFNDITDKKSSFSFQSIVDNALDVIIVTEADDISSPMGPRIIYVNDAFEKLTGYSRSEAIGETPRILQGKETDKNELKRIRAALENKQSICTKIRNYTKTGHPYWLSLNIFPLTNKYGEVTHFAAIERDVTNEIYASEQLESNNNNLKELKNNLQELVRIKTQELHDANKALYHHAYHDDLTNIPNRRLFLEQVEKQISRAKRVPQIVLIGLLDIDNFKIVNDTYGHKLGDEVLKKVAECFSLFFRQEDSFGRYGGEEFAFCILLENDKHAFNICERLRKNIADLKFEVSTNKTIKITVSIGASVSQASPDTEFNKEIEKADQALYKAKENGRNRAEIMIE